MNSDRFQSMPISSRLLYLELYARAGKDGLIEGVQSVVRLTNTSRGDLDWLVEKGFLVSSQGGWLVRR